VLNHCPYPSKSPSHHLQHPHLITITLNSANKKGTKGVNKTHLKSTPHPVCVPLVLAVEALVDWAHVSSHSRPHRRQRSSTQRHWTMPTMQQGLEMANVMPKSRARIMSLWTIRVDVRAALTESCSSIVIMQIWFNVRRKQNKCVSYTVG
jgi:hypothetical protein